MALWFECDLIVGVGHCCKDYQLVVCAVLRLVQVGPLRDIEHKLQSKVNTAQADRRQKEREDGKRHRLENWWNDIHFFFPISVMFAFLKQTHSLPEISFWSWMRHMWSKYKDSWRSSSIWGTNNPQDDQSGRTDILTGTESGRNRKRCIHKTFNEQFSWVAFKINVQTQFRYLCWSILLRASLKHD